MSDESAKGTFLLKEKDFVEWVDAEGNALPAVPKHWGADQMPAGATKKPRSARTSTSGSTSGSAPGATSTSPPAVDDFPSYTDKPRPEGWESYTDDQKREYIYDRPTEKQDPAATVEEPAGNASRDVWAEYAVQVKDAKPADLVDDDGKELGRDELRTKFGTQPAS